MGTTGTLHVCVREASVHACASWSLYDTAGGIYMTMRIRRYQIVDTSCLILCDVYDCKELDYKLLSDVNTGIDIFIVTTQCV